jgi:hypothetical protein
VERITFGKIWVQCSWGLINPPIYIFHQHENPAHSIVFQTQPLVTINVYIYTINYTDISVDRKDTLVETSARDAVFGDLHVYIRINPK